MSQMIDPNVEISIHPKTGRYVVDSYNNEPSLTDQSGKDESDVNKIMAKYEKTGLISHLNKRPGAFKDISGVEDYQTMLGKIQAAQDAFMTLPAATRLKFQNDPGQLISFLQDEKNTDEAIKLGLVEKPQTPPPTPPSPPTPTP